MPESAALEFGHHASRGAVAQRLGSVTEERQGRLVSLVQAGRVMVRERATDAEEHPDETAPVTAPFNDPVCTAPAVNPPMTAIANPCCAACYAVSPRKPQPPAAAPPE